MTSTATQPLDRSTIRGNLQGFANHWRDRIREWRETGAKHTEKSYAQQFWSDLLRSFGVIPERIALFEQDAVRATTGNPGFIDLFWSGVVLGEAKSLGADLSKAYDQALDYLKGGSIGQHEFPKFVLVSDFENFRLTKLGTDPWAVSFTVEEITDHIDQLMFLAGQETVTKLEEEEASIHASRLMANLFNAMLDEDVDEAVGEEAPLAPHDEVDVVQRTSMWMTRLLFLLYGDDAGLWEEDLFYRFVLHDTTSGNLGAQLNSLFQVLNTPTSRRRKVPSSMERFPYVNGSVFADQMPQEFFDDEMREALLACCRFHWTRISPAVFGAMFQLVKSKEARRSDGEHYTSERNILKLLEPLLLDDLRDRADRLIRNKSTSAADLRRFRDELAEMVFMDPACGCGNFLVVAYRELRSIETDIIVALRAKEGQVTSSLDVTLDQRLTIDQFHGIEINWWPAKIAETAMFLVDHQANRQLAAAVGNAPDRLPIQITAHIHHGNALSVEWGSLLQHSGSSRTYVFGNPPFVGKSAKSKQQVAEMKSIWGTKYTGYLDYVTAWHAKTMELLKNREGEFGFVTTNSIVQGQQTAALFGPLYDEGWHISFAHRTFAWDSEAPGKAAVHCVIVGFARDTSKRPRLWDYARLTGDPVEIQVRDRVNAYLIDGPEVLVARRNQPLSANLNPAQTGSYPADGGFFTVSVEDFSTVAADPAAAKYLRPYMGSRELLHSEPRWCLWLKDVVPSDVQSSPILRERLEGVRAFREASTNPGTHRMAAFPQLFVFDGEREEPYLCLPSVVSENRRYFTAARLDPEVIVTNLAFTVDDPDGFHFALASSSMFIAWQKAIGGRLKNDVRFGNTLTWNNFPVPEVPQSVRESVIKAGAGVLEARARHPERTLAEAYNPFAMDPALVRAHEALDREVDRLFGAARKLATPEQRLAVLFQRFAELQASS